MPLILPGNVGSATAATGYNIANSCRFNDGDSARFTRAFSAGDRALWTFSCWLKRSTLGTTQSIFACYNTSSYIDRMQFTSDDQLKFNSLHDNNINGNIISTAKFRDTAAWYHIVFHWDSSDGTSEDKLRMYVNNERITTFSTEGDYPSTTTQINDNGLTHEIGAENNGSFFDGYMAEVFFIGAQNYAPTVFGEYNEDSPTIWQPKDCKDDLDFSSANSFYLDFADSGDLDDDESGQGNDWTAVNLAAADQATDSPTNNFCTMNPLVGSTSHTFSEGNCKIVSSGSDTKGGGVGTFGLTAGKWYWEVKLGSLIANHTHGAISELTTELYAAGGATSLNMDTGATTWRNDDGGEVVIDGTVTTADYGIMAEDSIMGIALDMDNHNISYYEDGSALVTDLNISTTRGVIFPIMASGINCTSEVNFGGCSAFTISSAANDANGYGVFEYAPPSGFLALCTKNLGEEG